MASARAPGLVAAEVIYTVTDPPIRLFRRFIPPLRVGAIAIDFGFALTMLLCFILLARHALARGLRIFDIGRRHLRHSQDRPTMLA